MNLRTRIAAAISGVDDWRGVTDPGILADAVIRELGSFVNENGVWGVIDLLTEIAGPRCFAEGIPKERGR